MLFRSVSRIEFWDMLARLKQQGITILVSTPYQEEIKRCDEITTTPLPPTLGTTGNQQTAPATRPLYINKEEKATPNITTDNATRDISQAETIIHVSHLVKTFGTFNAVDDISFDVRRARYSAFSVPTVQVKPLPCAFFRALVSLQAARLLWPD